MTVSELIEKLKKFPGDTNVMVGFEDVEYGGRVQDIGGVSLENVRIMGNNMECVIVFDTNFKGL